MYNKFRFKKNLTIHCLFASTCCIVMFSYGFFPPKLLSNHKSTIHQLPTKLDNVLLNTNMLYNPIVNKMVFIVIDAFRLDFITNEEATVNMPFTSSLIKEDKACFFSGQVSPPTVTMPRIKAMMTGSVSNFIDVVLNFGSNIIYEDNFLHQAYANKLNIVFYGDDTWLKLYPKSFLRSEGTVSFFVSDFTEVDNNVTRHLKAEITANDWQIMILHYLGLDHIGHIHGPYSDLIKPKLHEMDSIIKILYTLLNEETKKTGEQLLLVISGDHGMKDTGGHGGASRGEIMIPIIAIGLNCTKQKKNFEVNSIRTVAQIDVAPTLSVLFGLPIPHGNLGTVIHELVSTISKERQLYYMYYNAKEIADRYVNTSSSGECLTKYEIAKNFHADFLKDVNKADPYETAKELYISSSTCMSDKLTASMIQYNMLFITPALVFLLMMTIILLDLLLKQFQISIAVKWIKTVVRVFVLLATCILICCPLFCDSNLCKLIVTPVFIIFFIALLLSYIAQIIIHCIRSSKISNMKVKFEKHLQFLFVGLILHTLSLSASSFIEEEHQIWYFLWCSLAVVILYDCLAMLILEGYCNLKPPIPSNKIKLCILQWTFVMFIHRILRMLNSTGDKWASIPDIGDWLKNSDKLYLSFTLFSGLLGVALYCCHLDNTSICSGSGNKYGNKILIASAVILVYLHQAAIGNVILFSYPNSRGSNEVYGLWLILSILLIKVMAEIIKDFIRNKLKNNLNLYLSILEKIFSIIIICWMIVCALLHRPYNVLLIGILGFLSELIIYTSIILTQDKCKISVAMMHYWLGMVFYFYQGNSNSLATIDVAAGYTGKDEYSFIAVGVLLLVNTFASPVLSYLLLIRSVFKKSRRNNLLWFQEQMFVVIWTYTFCRVLPLTFCFTMTTLQRYHLFIWSVFSPKVLYESVHTVVVLIECLILNTISGVVLFKVV